MGAFDMDRVAYGSIAEQLKWLRGRVEWSVMVLSDAERAVRAEPLSAVHAAFLVQAEEEYRQARAELRAYCDAHPVAYMGGEPW